jgi:hypothetical protein
LRRLHEAHAHQLQQLRGQVEKQRTDTLAEAIRLTREECGRQIGLEVGLAALRAIGESQRLAAEHEQDAIAQTAALLRSHLGSKHDQRVQTLMAEWSSRLELSERLWNTRVSRAQAQLEAEQERVRELEQALQQANAETAAVEVKHLLLQADFRRTLEYIPGYKASNSWLL